MQYSFWLLLFFSRGMLVQPQTVIVSLGMTRRLLSPKIIRTAPNCVIHIVAQAWSLFSITASRLRLISHFFFYVNLVWRNADEFMAQLTRAKIYILRPLTSSEWTEQILSFWLKVVASWGNYVEATFYEDWFVLDEVSWLGWLVIWGDREAAWIHRHRFA